MTDTGNSIERQKKRIPGIALTGQRLSTRSREPIVTATARGFLLDPAAFDQSLIFEPIECRIKGSHVEIDRSVGPLFDQPADFVAVPLAFLQKRKYQQFGASAFQFFKK